MEGPELAAALGAGRHGATCRLLPTLRTLPAPAAQERIVCVNGAIDDHMSNLVVAQLLYLESESPEKPVGGGGVGGGGAGGRIRMEAGEGAPAVLTISA